MVAAFFGSSALLFLEVSSSPASRLARLEAGDIDFFLRSLVFGFSLDFEGGIEAGKVALKAAGIASISAGGGDRSLDFRFCLGL